MDGIAVASIDAPKAECVIIGTKVEDALPKAMARLRRSRAFLLVSQSLRRKTSVIDCIQKALGSECVGCFDGVSPHTPREEVVEIARLVRNSGADVIITIGGGSLTDAAKVVQIAIAYNVTDVETLGKFRLGQPRRHASVKDLPVRYIAVPTTLSGGEFSAFAGVTDTQCKLKEPYGHKQCAPQVIILDPCLALHTPLNLWLSTGMRAVDHAVEAICSKKGNPYSSGLAQSGLKMLSQGLRKCSDDPSDAAARQMCQLGMWQATEAANIAGGGASHAIGHTLGGTANVAHGHTSCIMLPAVLHWNARHAATRESLKDISTALGSPSIAAATVMRDFIRSLGMPECLDDVGVGADSFEHLAKVTMSDNALRTNPRPINDWTDVVEILELALHKVNDADAHVSLSARL